MNRNELLVRLTRAQKIWDFIVIGGGATGLGVAVDAASRGFDVLLLERGDFGCGTSSRSTKLVHGGVRYLQQGNIALVLEALKERGILRDNAPHLVHDLPFVVPNYDWWEGPFYGIGLKIYDLLAGKHGFGESHHLSKEETIQHLPTIETEGLLGGTLYYDGQFDDARLAVNLAQTIYEQGGTPLNYVSVDKLIKTDEMVTGVIATDRETGKTYPLSARAVINATGVFTDSICVMDNPQAPPMIAPSQGIHIVLDESFLPGDSAIMVPHTDDGRVLFAIPWHHRTLVGTTDTPVSEIAAEPLPLPEEIEFLLKHTARYLTRDPSPKDVLSIFAGLRPLVKSGDETNTAFISRDHTLHISRSGLITITGGKWTTYRKMAEDTIDQALLIARLDHRPCVTVDLQLHGYHLHPEKFDSLAHYGCDAPAISDLLNSQTEWGQPIHPDFDICIGEIIWAVRHEMARTVEDFLSRRTRMLLLDARASVEMAMTVAEIMAEELKHPKEWIEVQVRRYRTMAKKYVV
ncbi:MAG: glycerol-3-phosphate dehydrogenase/oxidase [Candidatus Marinimicrobia bacterium]|nr:glycerol-3-phosphate dehydrogenase/oxidase [Candidatus Neomarinimicrobiota bacterium]